MIIGATIMPESIAEEIVCCVFDLLSCSDEELDYMDFISDLEFWSRYARP